MKVGIARTSALRDYRRLVGNATYLINTAIVGLEQVARGCVYKPDDLTIKWSVPKDKRAAANQSRALVLSSVLVLAVTACEAYIADVSLLPWLKLAPLDRSIASGAETKKGKNAYSVVERVQVLVESVGKDSIQRYNLRVGLAALELAVLWRNAIVHSGSETRRLSDVAHCALIEYSDELYQNNGKIDVALMLHHFRSIRSRPNLKEATTLVALVSAFVAKVDEALIRHAIPDNRSMMRVALHGLSCAFESFSKADIGRFFASDMEARMRRFQNALAAFGITAADDCVSPVLPLEDLVKLSRSDCLAHIAADRFPDVREEIASIERVRA